MEYTIQRADFSQDQKYRYSLERQWDEAGPRKHCTFVLLNPSTADAKMDDATVKRCAKYADSWGYCKLFLVNLYPLRATDPNKLQPFVQVLKKPVRADHVPSEYIHQQINYAICRHVFARSAMVVCAWGANPANPYLPNTAEYMLDWIRQSGNEPHCLRTTRDGHPSHPLYLPKILRPEPYHPKPQFVVKGPVTL